MKLLLFLFLSCFSLAAVADSIEFRYQSKSAEDTNKYKPTDERSKKCMRETKKKQFTLHIRKYKTTDGRELSIAVPQCAQAEIANVITCSYVSIGDGRELSDRYGDCQYKEKRVQTIFFVPIN